MVMDQKNQCCESHHLAKNNLQIQHSSHGNSVTFHRNRKINIEFIWKYKRPQRVKAVLYGKNSAGGSMIPDPKLYYRATVTKQHGIGTKTDT